jgi:hypothetical protein
VNSADRDKITGALAKARSLTQTLFELIPDLPSLPDKSDANMALMYLHHITNDLEGRLNP